MDKSEGESSVENGLLTITISNDQDKGGIVRLGDKIVIDARPQVRSVGSTWVNPEDFRKLGVVYSAIRKAYAKGEDMNIALKKAGESLGIKGVERAEVKGTPLSHWDRPNTSRIPRK